jgi:hypothetical protein
LNVGGSGTLLTAATSELQMDLMPLQNLPVFFNAASVTAQTYGQIELVLNSTTPANVVPLCPQSAPAGEGCISYMATVPDTSPRAQFTQAYNVTAGIVQPLVTNIAVSVGPTPTADPNNASVSLTPTLTPQGNVLPNSNVTFSPALAVVTGVVTNFSSQTTVTAELSGTAQLVSSNTLMGNGTFSLSLPARPAPDATLYDFYVSGNGAYVVKSRVPVCSPGTGTCVSNNDLGTLVVPSSSFGSITGTIADGCNGTAIEAATLKLLVPDTTAVNAAPTCDLTGEPPAIPSNCVVVATAATDDLGHYPLPNTPFTQVPVSPPPGVPYYDLQINGLGDNTTIQQVAAGTLFCPGSRFSNSCSFNLEHGFMTGTTELSGSNGTGNRLNALVMAEDAGTDHIENVGLSTIAGGATSGPFTMAVPDAAPSSNAIGVTNLDVFATVQDLFQGSPQKNSGQLIGTAASVGAPPSDCSTIAIPALSAMDCVGLGSVSGSTTTADPNTTSVRLSKDGVQIMETEPNSVGVTPNNVYNFCAPFDLYELTRYEGAVAQLPSTSIILARPLIVSAPCSTICQDGNPAGTCLLCQPTAGPTLAPTLP